MEMSRSWIGRIARERGSKFAQHDGFSESEAAKLVCMYVAKCDPVNG